MSTLTYVSRRSFLEGVLSTGAPLLCVHFVPETPWVADAGSHAQAGLGGKPISKRGTSGPSGLPPDVLNGISGLAHPQLQPVNASVAAVTLTPAVTVRGVLALVWLVCRTDGLQSACPAEPGRNAPASSV